MRAEKLIEEAENILVELGEFNRLKHLFSNDKDIRSLAELRRKIAKLLWHLKTIDFKEILFPKENYFDEGDAGALVKVRPCNDGDENKTYLGILLGTAKTSLGMVHVEDNKIQLTLEGHAPAIYIPDLKKVIYGYQCWWSRIESEEDLKAITDETIDDVWYVKLAKECFSADVQRVSKTVEL